jgi:NADH:ubiquinone oxidoreductase subunit 5 (subunit L)/multisubunit Na+/H+ antiporter MnhA subunit
VKLGQIGGLAQRMPLTAVLFLISSLSVLGAPPLAGAIAGHLIGAVAGSNSTLPIVWEAVTGLTALYLTRLFVALFLGELRGPVQTERRLPSLVFGGSILGALALLATLSTDLLALLAPIANVRFG